MATSRITSPVDYSRQSEFSNEMKNVLESVNVIIGCGGIGFWLGLFLAMNGTDKFIFIDGDTIEHSNLNRLPVPETFVGFNKAHALKRQVRFLRKDTQITAIGRHATEDIITNIAKKLVIEKFNYYYTGRSSIPNLIFWDTTDDARFQQKYYKLCKSFSHSNISYRKLGYEGYTIASYKNYNVWFQEDGYQPGYQTARANSLTSSMAACIGILSQAFNTHDDVTLRIDKLATNQFTVPSSDGARPQGDSNATAASPTPVNAQPGQIHPVRGEVGIYQGVTFIDNDVDEQRPDEDTDEEDAETPVVEADDEDPLALVNNLTLDEVEGVEPGSMRIYFNRSTQP
ncbi:ThiF family adenylyltransferase [Candidatus Omnitrophota bacterium]